MSLRPVTAHWFELLTSREELGATLDCLAGTGAVQLQAYSQSETRLGLPDLRRSLAEYETLARRYAHFWPAARAKPPGTDYRLTEAPREALDRLHAWSVIADPLVVELEQVQRSRTELQLLGRLLDSGGAALPRLVRVAGAGPVLAGRVYALAAGGPPLAVPPAVIVQRIGAGEDQFLIVVGPSEDVATVDEMLAGRKARRLDLPPDLPENRDEALGALAARREALDGRERAALAALSAASETHAIADALGELALAAWVVAHVPELPVTEHFAWVTGWCTDPDGASLRATLDARGLHYLLRFTAAPEGETPPSVLRNPRWARPFEAFTRLMGVPAQGEADPSVVVAVLAPLMFGYMFGDVAQGLIIGVAGAWLQRRIPVLRMLVTGGVAAVAFGFAFGSCFAREDLLPALWVRPLQQPLVLLGAALAFGVAVIALGLLLDALQHLWRGEFRRWLAADAGVVLAYGGLVCAVLDARALWALPAGIAWSLAGSALVAPGDRAAALGAAAGELLERLMQLGVNTVSFVRVGAFALAHAGLCSAVVGMAEAAGPGRWPVLIAGNAAIVALEGLVVSIQTTRLVLFEFFIRFLTARGRPFEPLPPPPTGTPTSLSGKTP